MGIKGSSCVYLLCKHDKATKGPYTIDSTETIYHPIPLIPSIPPPASQCSQQPAGLHPAAELSSALSAPDLWPSAADKEVSVETAGVRWGPAGSWMCWADLPLPPCTTTCVSCCCCRAAAPCQPTAPPPPPHHHHRTTTAAPPQHQAPHKALFGPASGTHIKCRCVRQNQA